MKRFKLKTLAILTLPALGVVAFSIWVLPVFTRPFALTQHQVSCGDLFNEYGIWYSAEVSYPRTLFSFLVREDVPPIQPHLILLDSQGRVVQGFEMGERYNEPGKSRAATFYFFRKLKNVKGPLRFTLKTDSEREDWNRLFPEIKIQTKDLPRKIGQKITAQ